VNPVMSAKETLFSFKVDQIGFSEDIVVGRDSEAQNRRV